MEASANLINRWHMGLEARVLVMLTGVLLAFGLATVYSASAIVEMQAGYGHAHLLIRQVTGMAIGLALFAIAAKMDAEVWEKWAWPIMILSLVLLVIVILPFTAGKGPRGHRFPPQSFRRVHSAVRAGQARGDRVDVDAGDQEGASAQTPHERPPAISRGDRSARHSRDAGAGSLDRDDVHPDDEHHTFRRRCAHRALCGTGGDAHSPSLCKDRAAELRPVADVGLLRSRCRAPGGELSAPAIADSGGVGANIRSWIWQGAPTIRLSPDRI